MTALAHPGHPCACANELCTNGERCPWRIVSVKRRSAFDGVFVAHINQGDAWVAMVKSPHEDASADTVRALAERVCAAMNGSAS